MGCNIEGNRAIGTCSRSAGRNSGSGLVRTESERNELVPPRARRRRQVCLLGLIACSSPLSRSWLLSPLDRIAHALDAPTSASDAVLSLS